MTSNHIYLDHGASTPVREEVLDAMKPFWLEFYGNPSSVHTFGREANRGLEHARDTFAELLNTDPDEIVFTGCGSESDNLALRGVMQGARSSNKGNHMITCVTEHKAVLETARQMRDSFGFDLTILPVDRFGRIRLEELKSSIRSDTVLISVMAANNEIGTLQPIFEIGEMAREEGVLFHTDAIQAAATYEWNMQEMPIDLLSLAAHKFYGPKGIGVLYVRRNVDLESTLTGGGQEDGRRSGTVNVPYAVGAAEAFRLAVSERKIDLEHYQRLRNRLIQGVQEVVPEDSMLTGHPEERLDHNASFAFRNVSGNDLLMHLDTKGISASSGSACLTGDPQPSPVLRSLGLDYEWSGGGLRLTVGRQNSDEDVEYVLEVLPEIVENLRELYRLQMGHAS
jgi:cysteine desulfurase